MIANQKARKTTAGLLSISIVLSLFVAFNGDPKEQIIMLAYAVMAAIMVVWLLNLKQIEFAVVGGAIFPDIAIGAAVGGIFVYLNQINSAFSLGAPAALLSLGSGGLFIALVLVAPIVEEKFFRGWLYPRIYNAVKQNNAVAIPLQALAFATYHFAIYGGFLGLIAAPAVFFGAFVFGVVSALMVRQVPKQSDITTLERCIAAHMVFNFWLWNGVFGLIAIGGLS